MYQRTQFGWVGFYVLMIIVVINIAIALFIPVPEARKLIMLSAVIPLFILLLIKDLTVTVDDEFIRLKYGIGLLKFKFPLSEIVHCEKIEKAFVMGWGIRFGLDYTLYNISGRDSVELTFRDKKRKVRIGTADLQGLYDAIDSRLRQAQPDTYN